MTTAARGHVRRPPWVVRALARLPLGVLYRLTGALAFLVFRVARVRMSLIDRQLAACFPDLGAAERARLCTQHVRQLGEMAAEALHGLVMPAEDLADRVAFEGLEELLAAVAGGARVLLMTGHCANWEWLLLALSRVLGPRLVVVYKPQRGRRGDDALYALRSRFGARPVPAKDLVRDVVMRRGEPFALAMAADQVPRTSPTRVWLRFLGRDTAFYTGAEAIARAARYPVYYVAARRVARGRYCARFERLARPGTEQADEVTSRFVARLERDIRAQPADWLWVHDRWKLRREATGEGPAPGAAQAGS